MSCDDVRIVVAVARKFPGTPMHVIRLREETFRLGKYRDLQAARLRVMLGPVGLPQALVAHVAAWKSVVFGMRGLSTPQLHHGDHLETATTFADRFANRIPGGADARQ